MYINLHSCFCMFVEHWKCANCPLIRKKRRHLPPSATHWGMSIVIGQIPVLISAILQILILEKVLCKNNSWAAFGSRMRNWLGSVVINHLSVCLSSIISPTWKKDPQPNYLFWGITDFLGGFIQKIWSQIGNLPLSSGWKFQNIWNTHLDPPSFHHVSPIFGHGHLSQLPWISTMQGPW